MDNLTLKAKLLDIDLGKFQVLLHTRDAEALGVHPGDRVRVLSQPHAVIAVVDVTDTVVEPGTLGVFADVRKHFSLEEGSSIHVRPAEKPESVGHIKKKMHGKKLSKDEIDRIVQDVVDGS